MKYHNFVWFLALLLVLVSFSTYAQTPANSDGDLAKAFKREFSYLATQNEVLQKTEDVSKSQYLQKKKVLEAEIKALERKLAVMTTQNEVLNEEVQAFEKRKRESAAKKNSLASTFRKAQLALDDVRQELNLDLAKPEGRVQSPKVSVKDYELLARESLQILKDSVRVQEIHASYLNETGDLVEGPILRFGRIGVQALQNGVKKVLAPTSEGVLQELKGANSAGPFVSLYVFENLKSASHLKKAAGFWDKLADAVPLVVLGALLLLVVGLFSLFARE
jgi:hypothetical protein